MAPFPPKTLLKEIPNFIEGNTIERNTKVYLRKSYIFETWDSSYKKWHHFLKDLFGAQKKKPQGKSTYSACKFNQELYVGKKQIS